MTTPFDAVPAWAPESQLAIARSAIRTLYWSVRRELWENRSIYIAPLVAAAVALLGFAISTVGLPAKMRALSTLEPDRQTAVLIQRYDIAAIALILTGLLVAAFYCLDALHSERRDRSILFWKSLPVSDLETVVAKASIPLVVVPIVIFVVVIAVQLAMLLFATAILLTHGVSAAPLWTVLPVSRMSLELYYGLCVLALWHAPIYAWLLLVSGWARRAMFLWAVLPPLALALVEKIGFGTSHFGHLLAYRVFGGVAKAFAFKAQTIPAVEALTPLEFLSTPGLWLGLAVAAAFLAAAVRLRRYGEPI